MECKPVKRVRYLWLAMAILPLSGSSGWAAEDGVAPLNAANPEAVEEVLSGERTEANAAWWGFNAEDVTESIQGAMDSGAKIVRIPYMGEPWIVRPISMRGDQEVYLEPGVVILAKEGEFLGRGDSLFTAGGVENVVLRGYGATLRMRKRDYMEPPYEKAEWRMGLSLRGSSNVLVEGVRIESSGGDGIYVDGGSGQKCSRDVTIRNVTCFDNHRQGMSVICVENLLLENCVFANTWGTAPAAGLDLEPDGAEQSLVNIVVRNCVFENNEGHEILVYPKNLHENAPDLSIRFENCLIRKTLTEGIPDGVEQGVGRDDRGHGWSGISVAAVCDDGPGGTIEFVNCVVENTGKESVRVFDKSAGRAEVRFVNCQFKNPWLLPHPTHWAARVPIHLQVRRPHVSKDLGGIVFEDCHVYDTVSRPVLLLDQVNNELGLRDVSGLITYHGPGEPGMELGPNASNIGLRLLKALEDEAPERKPDADAE
jgi:parallel beta helix pectate lyase-like protein